MTDQQTHPNRTPEDRLVTDAFERLPELKDFAEGKELKLALGADTDLIAEYGRDFVPLEEFEGTAWHAHVQDVFTWAEEAGFTVSLDAELAAADLPHDGRAIVNVALTDTASPLWMNVFCEVDGRVDVKIQVEPFDRPHEVYNGSVANLDVDGVRAEVNEYRPFVTGRVRELMHECGVKPSRARAIALREVGLTHEDVGDRLDITKGASGSYQSKFNTTVDDSEHLFIARTPTPKRVLAKHQPEVSNYLDERWYVCEEISPEGEGTDYPITLVTVQGDVLDVEGVTLDVSTRAFPSLRHCINAVYVNETFSDDRLAGAYRALFTDLPSDRLAEAGYDTLPHIGEVLDQQVP